MGDTIEVWITKHALSAAGIERHDAEDVGGGVVRVVRYGVQYYRRRDWHRTPEAAVARAEEMRRLRIANLRRQLARLEVLRFEEPADG